MAIQNIRYDTENQLFTLSTKNTSYQMKVDSRGFLLHLYYGARISGNMEYLLTYYDRGFSGNPYEEETRTYSLDVLPQEYPTLGTGDYRSSALIVRNADGTESCTLRYKEHTIQKGKYSLRGLPAVYATNQEAETLEISLEDAVSKVEVRLFYGVLWEEDIITRSAVIVNGGSEEIIIEKAGSACVDFLYGNYDLISFYGRHAMERNIQRSKILHGNTVIGSRRGASSHQYNPAVIIASSDATEDFGSCYGMAFVYSGNFQFEAEKDQFGLTRTMMGLLPEQFHYPLKHGEELIVPETILSYSASGFSFLSEHFHRCIRNHVCRGEYQHQVRPILLNSWEAAYFDFNGETIVGLAKEAAELGIDMVVMDDGWFGKRDDDNSGLGDWEVNEKKLGCTLKDLIRRVTDTGVKFGIWIEPEMISEDSELYRTHPDWALQIPGRKPVRSRNQLVLDFSREEVRNEVFDAICKVLDQGEISYVKWDMNRSLADIFSKEHVAGKVHYLYVLGVYEFLERLALRYPSMLIEGCCGGGGRFDAGMMYYTPQIWCSDNTDAVDRLRIQYGTSFFYPISVVGSHVSAIPNHQTGRKTSLKTRGIVAMAGTFGYELDPKLLGEEERAEIKEQIKTYRNYEDLIRNGIYYRLTDPFTDDCTAWLFVSKDKKQALLNIVVTEVHGNMEVSFVKLKGLQKGAVYRELTSGKTYVAEALMEAGLPVSVETGEYNSCQFAFAVQEKL